MMTISAKSGLQFVAIGKLFFLAFGALVPNGSNLPYSLYRRYGIHLVISFILLSWWVSTVQGQSNRQYFLDGKHIFSLSEWTQQDGLPSWLVIDMIQDKAGFIWLICDHKLVRFDGQNFKVYDSPTYGFQHRIYSALAEDHDGKIWLLSFTEERTEVEVFDPQTEEVQPLSDYINQPVSFPSERGRDYGFFSLNGVIWAVSSAGQIWEYDRTWRQVLRDTTNTLMDRNKWYIPSSEHRFWRHIIGTPNFHLIDSTGQILRETQLKAHRYGIDSTLPLWYMEPNHDPLRGVELRRVVDHKSVFSTDFSSHKWIWSSKHNNQNFRINQEGYGLFSETEESPDQLFYGKDILIEDLQLFLIENFGIQRHSPIFCLGDGAFWFSTTTGLARLEIRKNRFQNYLTKSTRRKHSCRGIYATSTGEIYVNSILGTYKISAGSSPQAVYQPPAGTDIYGFGLSKVREKLWIGMVRTVLLAYDPATAQLSTYPLEVGRGSYDYYWGGNSSRGTRILYSCLVIGAYFTLIKIS